MLGHDVLDAADDLGRLGAGGAGERLYPLTKERAKPAVYFGGPYRIIDFTLSNCINSGLRRIFIALQYKSLSLSRHLRMGWSVVADELGEFIEILSPCVTFRPEQREWKSMVHAAAVQVTDDAARAARRIMTDDGFNIGVLYAGNRKPYPLNGERPAGETAALENEFALEEAA